MTDYEILTAKFKRELIIKGSIFAISATVFVVSQYKLNKLRKSYLP